MNKIKIEIAEFFGGGYQATTIDGVCLVGCAKTQETCIKLAISRAKKGLTNGTVIEVYDKPFPWVKRPQTLLKTVTIGE